MVQEYAENSEQTTEKTEKQDKQLCKYQIEQRLISSKPCETKDETIEVLKSVCSGYRTSPINMYGPGNILLSSIPLNAANCKGREGVLLGIDEAGRGPILGPMTYAAAYWHPDDTSRVPKGFMDSKQLTSTVRESLFSKIKSSNEVGFAIRVLHASEISRNMQRSNPYNLNQMSHDSAIQLIRSVLDVSFYSPEY